MVQPGGGRYRRRVGVLLASRLPAAQGGAHEIRCRSADRRLLLLREREADGPHRVHRPAHRRELRHRPRRPELRRPRRAAAQRRPEGEVPVRAPGPRRRVQAGRGRADGDQGRLRHAPSSPASRTTARWWRWRRSTPSTASACRPWSGARCCPTSPTRNNFKEIHRVNGTMINQNDTNAKFMAEPRLQAVGGHPRHHRLRQGAQQVLQPVLPEGRRQDRRHLRRHRRPAGLHRRADADQGAQSGGRSTSAA